MLRKLALGGLKSRFRDYSVLFSGLVFASAVFYMFMALATNTDFLQANSAVGSTSFIFMFGAVLLSIITLVYIVYANSFLMRMRQSDYAMFMMLGAKSGKIAELIAIETMAVGVLATALGVIVGIGATTFAGGFMIRQLHSPAAHFSAFWMPAVIVTLIFFIVLFVIAAFVNARKLVRTPVLNLLHEQSTPNRSKRGALRTIIQALLSLALLAIGYWAMANFETLALMGIALALVTIVSGSYLLFDSLLTWVVGWLKNKRSFSGRGLRAFTLAQLNFRLRDYTKILSIVSILFALALGAITVGLGFKNEVKSMTAEISAYDVVLQNPTAQDIEQVAQLKDATVVTYHVKSDGSQVYFKQSEIKKTPLQVQALTGHLNDKKRAVITTENFAKYKDAASGELNQFYPSKDDAPLPWSVLPDAQFDALNGTSTTALAVSLADLPNQYEAVGRLVTSNKKNGNTKIETYSKFGYYTLLNGVFSGMAFMGFFLGLAFLAMLASTLMFKILSGASYDQKRYLMLQKIGVKKNLLKRSIRQEIGSLFAFPGMLGIAHVLFGLLMFEDLLSNPYDSLWIPFGIFLLLYLLYYLVTVWLYTHLVIKKKIID